MAELEWPVIGIDLGTAYSRVAVWGNNGVEIIPNELGSHTTPSYISFTEYDRFIGEAAVNQAVMNPQNTIFDVKRLIGRPFGDKSLQQDNEIRPYKVIHGAASHDKDQLLIPVNYMGEAKILTPIEITAMTLAKMKGVAEAFTGKTVNNAVISVPAFFNVSQRRATKDAGTIAGFKWIHIINEPTAVALAYYDLDMKMNRGKRGQKNVLVFDLGGGTFDVSLVVLEMGKVTVKAVSGDTKLGGADFDNRMVREFVMRFKLEHDKDILGNSRAIGRLRVASEKAKEELSSIPQVDVQINNLFEGIDFSSTITRARFEELNMDLFEKCIATVRNCLMDAGLNKMDVDDIVLVGGSTRIPKVQQMLREFFPGKELCKSVDQYESVAYGAAMHAFITQISKKVVVSDVTPLSLGVELYNGKMCFTVPRNTSIPIKHLEPLTLCEDKNYCFKFGVYEGEFAYVKNNFFLGACEFTGFHLPKGTNIHVYFNIGEDGLLDVYADIEVKGVIRTIKMKRHGRLTRDNIQRMVHEAGHYKAKDETRRLIVQAKNNLERYFNTISDRLGDDIDESEMRMNAMDAALGLLEQNLELPHISAFEDMLSHLKTIFGVSE